MRLFCFVHGKTVCRYDGMYLLAALVLVCVDVMVMSSMKIGMNVYIFLCNMYTFFISYKETHTYFFIYHIYLDYLS